MAARLPTAPDQRTGPELFIGIVCPVGTDIDLVSDGIQEALLEVDYSCVTIHLSRLLEVISRRPWNALRFNVPEDIRLDRYMSAGNRLRKTLVRGDALALLGVGAIREEREASTGDEKKPITRCAYLIRQLKHPDEVRALRSIYTDRFLLVAAYAPRENRVQTLSARIAESRHSAHGQRFRAPAEELIERDEAESDKQLGQNVRDTFPLADLFVDTSDATELRKSLHRFIQAFFGYPFHTPNKDEFGMFHARAAALRSAALPRQVGAVISTCEGDIVAVGTNEVPKAGGGLYWSDDCEDHRDFTLKHDVSDVIRRVTLAEVIDAFGKAGWLRRDVARLESDTRVAQASSLLKDAQLMRPIEFARAVHAEMAALLDAARRGAAVRGCRLYTTTFPCHDCAKHIVAAGLEQVFYVEPYPKSLAARLYPDSIAVDGEISLASKIRFRPFVGIAPRQYMNLFEMLKRKNKDGSTVKWNGPKSVPKIAGFPYLYLETTNFKTFVEKMHQKGLKR